NHCVSTVDSVILTVAEKVDVSIDVGDDIFICADDSVELIGEIEGGASAGVWSNPGGDGYFSDVNALNTVYFPGPGDIANGSVRLVLTSEDPVGPCGPEFDQVNVTISPPLIADAGADRFSCQGQPVQLGG